MKMSMFGRMVRTATVVAAGTMLAGAPSMAMQHEQGGKAGDKGVAALMQSNRENLKTMVESAYFTGVQQKLEATDYQKIGKAAKTVSANAQQVREKFSKGEKFDGFAEDLEEHATKAAKAAEKGDHPELNVEIGEMAEYCAGCHDAYRWQRK